MAKKVKRITKAQSKVARGMARDLEKAGAGRVRAPGTAW